MENNNWPYFGNIQLFLFHNRIKRGRKDNKEKKNILRNKKFQN